MKCVICLIACLVVTQHINAEVALTCPVGRWKRGNRCYHFASGYSVQRNQAVNYYCTETKSQLYVPSSASEYRDVAAFLDNHPDIQTETTSLLVTQVWLGCSDEEEEGVYKCVDGRNLSSSSDWWLPGDPNNDNGNEHCVVYEVAGAGMKDVRCEDNLGQPMCEGPAVETRRSKSFSLARRTDGSLIKRFCLIGHTWRTARDKSLNSCAAECLNDVKCRSYNYYQDGVCELNNGTRREANQESFSAREGCNYFEPID